MIALSPNQVRLPEAGLVVKKSIGEERILSGRNDGAAYVTALMTVIKKATPQCVGCPKAEVSTSTTDNFYSMSVDLSVRVRCGVSASYHTKPTSSGYAFEAVKARKCPDGVLVGEDGSIVNTVNVVNTDNTDNAEHIARVRKMLNMDSIHNTADIPSTVGEVW